MSDVLQNAMARQEEIREVIVASGAYSSEGDVIETGNGVVDSSWSPGNGGEWSYGDLSENEKVAIYLSRLGGAAVAEVLVQATVGDPSTTEPNGIYQLRTDGKLYSAKYATGDEEDMYLVQDWHPAEYGELLDVVTSTHFHRLDILEAEHA
jgi:hypothetical protein